ncbi:MAG: hypothetical protein R6U96_16885 [Promethearchaeia archaeon]
MLLPVPQLDSYFKPIKRDKGLYSVWGQFGVGKTYFALQTALSYAKKGEHVLYIYTKPKLPSHQLQSLLTSQKNENQENCLNYQTFLRVYDFDELFSLLFQLEFLFLKQKKGTGPTPSLLIVDNIINLYQLELNPQKKEINVDLNYSLNQMLGLLTYLIEEYDIDILLINNMSYADKGEGTIEHPAGGNVIDYWVPYSIKIQRTSKINQRKFVIKTPEDSDLTDGEFQFKLTDEGFQ